MPGYHVVAGARTMMNGNLMELLSTMRPGRMAVYQWDKPLGPFLWPMNTMRRLEDEKDFNYEQLETYMMQSDYYWIARIYKSHSGLLDAYLRFKGEDRVTRYILEFDAADVTMTWPQPCDFYLARRAIRTDETMTLRDYDGGQAWAPMAPPMVPAIPAIPAIPAAVEEAIEEGETDEAAIEEGGTAIEEDDGARRQPIDEGGTVFLCNGMFLFCFPFFSPARVLFFISYCFDYSRFFDFFRFPIFFRI
jgi:hypothetical protein